MQDISFVLLGFFTGISLILAIGAQNIFVIEQGLKRQYVFLVCLICSISDLLLIFLGIFLFEYFRKFFSDDVELVFNILLLVFLVYFIITKIRIKHNEINIGFNNNAISLKNTRGFNLALNLFYDYQEPKEGDRTFIDKLKDMIKRISKKIVF